MLAPKVLPKGAYREVRRCEQGCGTVTSALRRGGDRTGTGEKQFSLKGAPGSADRTGGCTKAAAAGMQTRRRSEKGVPRGAPRSNRREGVRRWGRESVWDRPWASALGNWIRRLAFTQVRECEAVVGEWR